MHAQREDFETEEVGVTPYFGTPTKTDENQEESRTLNNQGVVKKLF